MMTRGARPSLRLAWPLNEVMCIALARPWAWLIACLITACLAGCASPLRSGPPTASASYWLKSSRPNAHTLVVFVHGVMGDSHDTWRGSGNTTGWPDLIESDPDLPSLDVLSLGYASPALGRASNIEEIAVRSLGSLRDAGVFERYDNVIFVAHSMGGLVTKRMLTTLQAEHRSDFDKVRAVVFFATPANGSDIASMVEWMSSNPQFRDMTSADFSSFLQVLDNDWQALLRNRPAAAPFPRAYCAYEKLPMHGIKVVVPRSASQSGCDETPVAFDRDHASIVKPVALDDEIHQYLRARILTALDPRLVATRVTAKVIAADGQPLRAGGVMRDGERYAIELESTQSVWFYVYNVDSTDHVQRLFPAPASGNQQTAIRTLHLPRNQGQAYALDDKKGVERLYIFARSAPDSDLGELGVDVAGSVKEDQQSLAELQTIFGKSRGTAGVVPRRLDPSGVTQLQAVAGEANEVLMFEHR